MKYSLRAFVYACVSILCVIPVKGQVQDEFWQESPALPAITTDDKFLCITSYNTNDQLYVGTTEGIWTSLDEGHTWSSMESPTIPIFFLEKRAGLIVGSSIGNKIIISEDEGTTWKTSSLPEAEAISDILILDDQSILVATGHIVTKNEVGLFRGNGLYRSNDFGKTWRLVQTGVPDYYYISHLAQHDNYVFIGYNEYGKLDGKVLYSSNKGYDWQELPAITFDWGDGSGTSSIARVTHLSFDSKGSIYLSFQGAYEKAATSVILKNTVEGALSGAEWTHMNVVRTGYPWFYLEAYNLYVADNQDVYATLLGTSPQLSGLFYRAEVDTLFHRVWIDPVFFNDGSYFFNYTTYAELKNGKIFAVQQLDNNIYYSTQSMKTPLAIPSPTQELKFELYPNPASDHIRVQFGGFQEKGLLSIYSFSGTELLTTQVTNGSRVDIGHLAGKGGIFMVTVTSQNRTYQRKLIIQSKN